VDDLGNEMNKSTPPNFTLNVPISDNGSEMDVWEPPFERWIKLADDLLTGWVCVNASVPQQRARKLRLASREN
jgi:hypothetical protein